MKILVCGGRHFDDYDVFSKALDSVIVEIRADKDEIELVSGGCKGTDNMTERYAEENSIPISVFNADWKRYGRAAGPIRNRQMIDYIKDCDHRYVIAFTSDRTKGTRNTIDLANKCYIKVFEFDYKKLIDEHRKEVQICNPQ